MCIRDSHYTDRHRLAPAVEAELGLTFHDDAASMVPFCDVVTINAPLHPETEHLFDDSMFDRMKRGTYLVNTARGKICDRDAVVRALTGGNGADVCIEAVGNPAVMEQAFYARDLAGTLVQVGVPTPEMRIDLPMIEFFGRGGQLRPSWYGDCLPSRDFPVMVDLYLQGRLDLDRFVSETITLGQVEEAFHRMERGEVLRSVVTI